MERKGYYKRGRSLKQGVNNMTENSSYLGRYWHMIEDGRMQCDLCPRDCKLHEGQRGACFVRMRQNDPVSYTHLDVYKRQIKSFMGST